MKIVMWCAAMHRAHIPNLTGIYKRLCARMQCIRIGNVCVLVQPNRITIVWYGLSYGVA